MPDPNIAAPLLTGAIAGLAQALPVVIGALMQIGQPELAVEVERILGPQCKTEQEIAAQDKATKDDLKLP